MTKQLPTRMEYTPEIGKARGELYRGAMRQLKNSMAEGFYIEAVALCESVISDRLESRLSFLNDHSPESRKQRSLSALLKYLRGIESPKIHPTLHSLYAEIEKWRDDRNRSIHNAVKLSDGDILEAWEARYARIQEAAVNGRRLVNSLVAEMKRLKDLREREEKKRIKAN